MSVYMAGRLAEKVAEFERAMMIPRAPLRVGRGHCSRCFSPWMCANAGCGCHRPKGATCGTCHAPLFVAVVGSDAPIFTALGVAA